MAVSAFHTDFGDFTLDDSAPYAHLRFPPEVFFTMTRTLHRAFAEVTGLGFTTCVIDMSVVTYLDSSAVSALIGFDDMMRERGGWVRVTNGGRNAHLRRLFDILGLERRFTIYENDAAATDSPALPPKDDAPSPT